MVSHGSYWVWVHYQGLSSSCSCWAGLWPTAACNWGFCPQHHGPFGLWNDSWPRSWTKTGRVFAPVPTSQQSLPQSHVQTSRIILQWAALRQPNWIWTELLYSRSGLLLSPHDTATSSDRGHGLSFFVNLVIYYTPYMDRRIYFIKTFFLYCCSEQSVSWCSTIVRLFTANVQLLPVRGWIVTMVTTVSCLF